MKPHRPQRGSEWLAIRRSLAILRRLQRGPASQAELIAAVLAEAGLEAYPSAPSARQAAFKRDCRNLRQKFQADFPYDFKENLYQLTDPGSLGYLELSARELQALRLLDHTFAGDLGERADIRDLLESLAGRLAPQIRLTLETMTGPLDLDVLHGVDNAPIAGRVWQKAQQAVREQRELSFHYFSPLHTDGLPRLHRAAPSRIRFRNGHWYLYACDLYRRDPDGAEEMPGEQRRFRLNRIADDEQLYVSPRKRSAGLCRPKQYHVHYRLAPVLGRGGSISRHFEAMTVERLPDDSVELEGQTDDILEAVRILLGYGENCIVLGGAEVRERVEQAVRGMARLYGLDEDNE